MARKTILVCDNCGVEVEEGKGAVMRITFTDARRGAKAADLCDGCAGTMPGNAVARRGRKPKSARLGTRAAGGASSLTRTFFPLFAPSRHRSKEAPRRARTTMGKWVSRSSSGRRTPARSRSCSTGSSTRSTAIPG